MRWRGTYRAAMVETGEYWTPKGLRVVNYHDRMAARIVVHAHPGEYLNDTGGDTPRISYMYLYVSFPRQRVKPDSPIHPSRRPLDVAMNIQSIVEILPLKLSPLVR